MTKEEFYSNPAIIERMKGDRPMYAANAVRFRTHIHQLKCGRCSKNLTEVQYVFYSGYCDDCYYEVNKPKPQRYYPQDDINLLLKQVNEFKA